MSISQFFILSSRGDSIIFRDFRRDIKKGTNEIFFRKVTFWDENTENDTAPPFFNIEGVNYVYSKKFDLYFVITSRDNFSPSYFIEVIDRLMKVIKDHCGILSEESIRKNFILLYEIIDEMIDFGYPQLASTEQVKPFVFTEPIVVTAQKIQSSGLFGQQSTISSNAVQAPMSQNIDKKKKNQIFVDLFEKLTVLFNSKGNVVNCCIDGCIQMKSYLKGNPELKLSLNEDMAIGKTNYSSSLAIDDVIFHSCVGLKEFESNKVLTINPPDGEFTVMNYRITQDFTPPFKIYAIIEESSYKLELRLRIQGNFSDKFFASNVLVKFSVPKTCSKVHFEKESNKSDLGQATDYVENEKNCYWKIVKFVGGAEHSLTARITMPDAKPGELRKEVGPISMTFEIPNFNISKIQIKELKIISTEKNYEALRWVRHVTQASSYVARIN